MNKLLLFLSAAILSACSHLAVTIPTPIIETPEISGADETKIGAGVLLQSGHRYKATTDASARPPNLTAPETDHVLSTLGGVNLDFAKRIRVGLGGDPINGGVFAKAQVQVFGEGQSSAKKGNASMSVFGHIGQHTPDKDGDQSSTFGPGGNPWKAEIKTDWYDFGASLGYRITDSANLFIGAAKQLTLYQTKIDHTQGAAPNGTYRTHDRGEANRAMLGLAFGDEKGELFIGADYTDIRYGKAPPLYVSSASLGYSLNFK